jgi:toluene monooxygenase system ferredoxin subunit
MSEHAGLRADELWIGEMKGVLVDGRRVLVLRLEDGVFAYEDRCAHLGVPLSEGTLEAGVLTCRAHHFQYDARTGAGINPRDVKLAAVPLRVDAGLIVFGAERAGEKS